MGIKPVDNLWVCCEVIRPACGQLRNRIQEVDDFNVKHWRFSNAWTHHSVLSKKTSSGDANAQNALA